MTSQELTWTWSEEHRMYYRYEIDANGRMKVVWSEPALKAIDHAALSATSEKVADVQQRSVWPHGTPDRGWYESLDPNYYTRTRSDAHKFWVTGRVFAVLWSETAGNAGNGSSIMSSISSTITMGRYGEMVHSQIRRFVVVKVNRMQHFVLALAISTYGGRGTLKPGCNPSEHAIICLAGSTPHYLPGELERGMVKEPIEVIPTDSTEHFLPASRLRFGKVFSIECNVKARDIGMVKNKTTLLQHYMNEKDSQFEPDELSNEQEIYNLSQTRTINRSPHVAAQNPHDHRTPEQGNKKADMQDIDMQDANRSISVNNYETRLRGDLHHDFEVIGSPRSFFKKGRVVMVPWPELGGPWVKESLGPSEQAEPPVKIKIRRLVVIRPRATFCLCLSINTYQGQATTKTGIAVHDHAAVVVEDGEVVLHEREAELQKSPLFIRVENQLAPPISTMSRIDFGKVYTLEYNIKVRNIGRLLPESIRRMDEYFVETSRTSIS